MRASLLVPVLLLAGQALAGSDEAATQAQLQQLRERIQTVEARLAKARGQESRTSQSLSQIESRIGGLQKELRQVKQRQTALRQRLAGLESQQTQQRKELSEQQRHLNQQVRAAYLLGRQQQLKLLLSQEDPQEIGRSLVYYHYLNSARQQRIQTVQQTLADLRRLQTEIETTLDELDQSRSQQQQLLTTLGEQASLRHQALARLRKDIRQGGDDLGRMQRDEARLQALLKDLRTALADVEKTLGGQTPFGELKKHLNWPAPGQLAARFGQPRSPGLRWRGVFIAAPENQPVMAVSHGRVAFADWLRGFGLLIIVDHGEGYMTLYGHNQALYQDVGDWVEAGQVIAGTGDSGGQARTGLYFELRKNGKPLDPLKWLAGKPPPLQTAGRS